MNTSRRKKSISEYIADRIMRNQMRVKFSTAHADFLQETYMSDQLNNGAAPLRNNPQGTQADAKKMPAEPAGSTTTSYMSLTSQIPVSVKKTDFKDLKTGEDFRGQAAQPNPLAGNDKPVRGATSDQLEGVGE